MCLIIMDPKDLLYTNTFISNKVLSKKELQQNSNNFLPFREIKNNSVNDVQEQLNQVGLTETDITQKKLKAEGWNRGSLNNALPILSNTTRDLVEDKYYRYRKSIVNIDSRFRDFRLYPKPNNFNVFLGRNYTNVTSIKVLDYNIPNYIYPINERNNVLVWFTVPDFLIQEPSIKPLAINLIKINNMENLNYVVYYSEWAKNLPDCVVENTLDNADCLAPSPVPTVEATCEDKVRVFRNEFYKNIFKISIPPGNYTVKQLEDKIESVWNKQCFYNSLFYEGDKYNPGKSPEPDILGMPQNVKVKIDPETGVVKALLRMEEYKIDYLRTYKGQNCLEVGLKFPPGCDTSCCSFYNNTKFAIVPTGFPDIGGLDAENINCKEFVSEITHQLNLFFNKYALNYIVPKIEGGNIVPNVFLLYFFVEQNVNKEQTFQPTELKEIYFSSDELITEGLEGAKIGREQPFYFLYGENSPVLNYVTGNLGNNAVNLVGDLCSECDGLGFEINDYCKILECDFLDQLGESISNRDGSSRLLTNYLGFKDQVELYTVIGPNYGTRGIQTNKDYYLNDPVKTVNTLTLFVEEAKKFIDCQDPNGAGTVEIRVDFLVEERPSIPLPICKDQNGEFVFVFQDYIFLKLLGDNLEVGTNIEQILPTSQYGYNSGSVYLDRFNMSSGYENLNILTDPKVKVGCIPPELQNTNNLKFNNFTNKDLSNIFAKIKISSIPGNCEPNKYLLSDIVFFQKPILNIDNFTVLYIDYEGKIIDMNWDTTLTLEIVERINLLKETNIDSRSGTVNVKSE